MTEAGIEVTTDFFAVRLPNDPAVGQFREQECQTSTSKGIVGDDEEVKRLH
jgi:hypothetical protein